MCENPINFTQIAGSAQNAQVKQIFTALATGEVELCQKSKPIEKQAILVLDSTNSDRSIFTRWIAGQDAKFESQPDDTNLGEYVIVDSDENANKSSVTTVPILISDPQAGAFYYNIAPFADSSDLVHDIASTYLTKKFMENVSSVKICFLIEHYKLTYPYRYHMRNFLTHVAKLVKNPDKVNGGVVLIASQVPSAYSKTSNDQIIDGIVLLMQTLKQQLQKSSQNEIENSKMIKILDLFMLKKQNVYPSIALFRSPLEQGFLSNLTSVEVNKAQLRKQMENLSFVDVNNDDFAFVVSKDYLHDITKVTNEIRPRITNDLKTRSDKVQQHFAAEEAMINAGLFETDWLNLYNEIKFRYEKMRSIRKFVRASANLKECLNRIIGQFANITDSPTNLNLSATVDSINAMEFLHTIAGSERMKFGWCVDSVDAIMQYLDDSRKWYYFAKNLYDRLLRTDISNNTGTYSITNRDNDKRVSETNLQPFLMRNYREQLYFQYYDIKDVVLTEFKVDSAQRIANLTTEYRKKYQLCLDDNSVEWEGPAIDKVYKTARFLYDLYQLERKLCDLSNCKPLPYYLSLNSDIEKYIQARASKNQTLYYKDYVTLNYIQMSVLSRIQSIDNRFDYYVVLNDLDFYSVKKKINDLAETLKYIQIETHRKQYERMINMKIIQLYVTLESIIPQMDEIHNSINSDIEQLIQNANNSETRNKLASRLLLKASMGILDVACVASFVWGPIAAVASSAEGLILSTFNGYLNPSEDGSRSMVDGAQQLADRFRGTYPTERRRILDHLLKSTVDKIDESAQVLELIEKDQDFNNVKNNVMSFIKLLVDNLLDETVYWRNKKLTKDTLRQYYEQLLRDGKPDEDEISKKKRSALVKWAERVINVITVAESGIQDFEQSKNFISKVGDSIKQVESTIDKLKAYEHRVRAQLLPEIGIIQGDMINVLNNSTQKPRTVFDVNRYMLQNVMRDLKKNVGLIIQIPIDSPILQNISACVDKLFGAFGNFDQIHSSIKNYKRQTSLSKYLSNVRSNQNYEEYPCLSSDIVKLEQQCKYNLILHHYISALVMFKHFLFPFAYLFADRFNVTALIKPPNPNKIASMAIQHIDQLRRDLSLSEEAPSRIPPNTIFFNARFDAAINARKAFFIWRHNAHREKISKLLQGHEITLKADVRQSRDAINNDLNAVKFNEIGIRFSLDDKQMENQLHELLANFWITMTHLGDSHYKCGNEYYIYDHDIVSVTHSVNTRQYSDGRPHYHYSDTVGLILRRNLPIFSPYAKWKIKLLSRSFREGNFQKLEPFINKQIDLALEGQGSYVHNSSQVCQDDVKKYYNQGTFSRQAHYDHYEYDPEAPFATNSANNTKSPINIAVKWLTGPIGYFTPSWISNAIHHSLTKDGFRSTFVSSKLSDAYTMTAANSAKFSFYETLSLADLFIRWLTKAKPYNNTVFESMNSIEIKAFVLNVVEQVENLMRLELPNEFNVPFDALALISKLEKALRNDQNATTIRNVLYRAVVDANPNLEHAPSSAQIWKKITEMVLHLNVSKISTNV